MVTCPHCSALVGDGYRFCPNCGTAAPATGAEPSPADLTRTSAPEPQNSRKAAGSSSSGFQGQFEAGTRIGGRYRIVALLGRGGMGEVYRADDLELGQSVALKFLPPALAGNAGDLARFRSEVRVARQIAHPNVCRVYDIGDAGGHVFLSMEYIDGEDLASVLRRMGRPSMDKAVEIARQICLGLGAAHEAGMLHRDLKPANVMIDGRGRVRITDFGLAGFIDEFGDAAEVAGTPAYMAPEQLTDGRASVKSDIYALGLVLYEVFTGTRVFATQDFEELRRLHESESMTTPSDLVRDLDPAIERIVLHCLKLDPDLRPASAYAVLAALPGGDPLAAALAAGETPSPELVANAGERGTTAPGTVTALVGAGLLAIALIAAIVGPYFEPLVQPTEVLTVRATDVLAKTGAFSSLPTHTAESFTLSAAHLEHLRTDATERARGATPFYFWKRWSSSTIEAVSIHAEAPYLSNPPLAPSQAAVLLDPAGRLVGLRIIPLDAVPAGTRPATDWQMLFRAAQLDPASFTPTTVSRPVPPECDEVAAWTGTLPFSGAEPVTVLAGASRGRPVYFSIVHDWGASTRAVDPRVDDSRPTIMDWLEFAFVATLPLLAAVYFSVRNLRLGRGDRPGATRIALYVFAMNLLESAFTARLSEDGPLVLGWDWISGRGLAHSLLHGATIWFGYVALEPYVRRLWPRLLVSWARLASGRVRDPLVGRDLLIGTVVGLGVTALGVIVQFAALRWGHGNVPTLVGTDALSAATSLSLTGLVIAYAGSVSVLQTLRALMMLLLLRLLLRRTWPAVVICAVLYGANAAYTGAPTDGWLVASLGAIVFFPVVYVTLMGVGLLPGVTAMFVSTALSWTVTTLDFSSWYADRALFAMVVIVALLAYGAWTALGGVPILGDPLRDVEPIRRRAPAGL